MKCYDRLLCNILYWLPNRVTTTTASIECPKCHTFKRRIVHDAPLSCVRYPQHPIYAAREKHSFSKSKKKNQQIEHRFVHTKCPMFSQSVKWFQFSISHSFFSSLCFMCTFFLMLLSHTLRFYVCFFFECFYWSVFAPKTMCQYNGQIKNNHKWERENPIIWIR